MADCMNAFRKYQARHPSIYVPKAAREPLPAKQAPAGCLVKCVVPERCRIGALDPKLPNELPVHEGHLVQGTPAHGACISLYLPHVRATGYRCCIQLAAPSSMSRCHACIIGEKPFPVLLHPGAALAQCCRCSSSSSPFLFVSCSVAHVCG